MRPKLRIFIKSKCYLSISYVKHVDNHGRTNVATAFLKIFSIVVKRQGKYKALLGPVHGKQKGATQFTVAF